MKRYAIVRNARTRREAEAYLPDNYAVIAEFTETDEAVGDLGFNGREGRPVFVIEGVDRSGWTLDDYVIPRYASGLIQAREVDLSDPVFKSIPLDAGQADFHLVGNPGDTVFLLIPRNGTAQEWVDANLPEDAQTLGRGIAVEHRYIGPILEGIEGDGFQIKVV